MPEHIADAQNVPPRNLRVGFPQFVRDAPAGFGDDLYAALNRMPQHPVMAEFVKALARESGFDAFDGLEYVVEARPYCTSHQKIRSAEASIFFLRRG